MCALHVRMYVCMYVCMYDVSLSLCRSDIDPDNLTHMANARRLFEAMLMALQEVCFVRGRGGSISKLSTNRSKYFHTKFLNY